MSRRNILTHFRQTLLRSSCRRAAGGTYCYSFDTNSPSSFRFSSRATGAAQSAVEKQPSAVEKPPFVSRELCAAAAVADRVTKLAAGRHKKNPGNETIHSAVKRTQSTHGPLDVSEAKQVMEATESLLAISRPSNALADAILVQQEAPAASAELTSLHLAFLSTTTWCLDILEQCYANKNKNQEVEPERKALLDRALVVSRRANDLNLPFYLPLYQRLMAAVAQQYVASHNTDESNTVLDETANTIMEIAGWISSRLNASAVTAELFDPVLQLFLEHDQYKVASRLLESMESHYGVDNENHTVTLLKNCVKGDDNKEPVNDNKQLLFSALSKLLESPEFLEQRDSTVKGSFRDKMEKLEKLGHNAIVNITIHVRKDDRPTNDDDDDDSLASPIHATMSFPDVTLQLSKLNGTNALSLTDKYEYILWGRSSDNFNFLEDESLTESETDSDFDDESDLDAEVNDDDDDDSDDEVK